jgi:hypothetical protein
VVVEGRVRWGEPCAVVGMRLLCQGGGHRGAVYVCGKGRGSVDWIGRLDEERPEGLMDR